jgi:hypothetical protein
VSEPEQPPWERELRKALDLAKAIEQQIADAIPAQAREAIAEAERRVEEAAKAGAPPPAWAPHIAAAKARAEDIQRAVENVQHAAAAASAEQLARVERWLVELHDK